MIQLYHNDMSSCSQKVRLGLAEKHLDWGSEHLSLRDGDQYEPAYLALNPNGVVPTLVDDGHVIIESQVILEYLDDAYPEPPLRPANATERARMRLWTKQLDEGVHAYTGVISTAIAFRHQFLQKTPEELDTYLQRVPDAARRERKLSAIHSGTASPMFEPAIRRFDTLFSDMERTLARSPWRAGDSYSLADVSYTPYLVRFEHLHLFRMLDKRPHLRDWYERVTSRSSYQTAMTQWENAAYFEIYHSKAPQEWPRVEAILKSVRPDAG